MIIRTRCSLLGPAYLDLTHKGTKGVTDGRANRPPSPPDHLNPGRLNRASDGLGPGFGRVGPGPKPLGLRRGLLVRVASLPGARSAVGRDTLALDA
jgi:hypothetical protein